jgi:hypothetical protein
VQAVTSAERISGPSQRRSRARRLISDRLLRQRLTVIVREDYADIFRGDTHAIKKRPSPPPISRLGDKVPLHVEGAVRECCRLRASHLSAVGSCGLASSHPSPCHRRMFRQLLVQARHVARLPCRVIELHIHRHLQPRFFVCLPCIPAKQGDNGCGSHPGDRVSLVPLRGHRLWRGSAR